MGRRRRRRRRRWGGCTVDRSWRAGHRLLCTFVQLWNKDILYVHKFKSEHRDSSSSFMWIVKSSSFQCRRSFWPYFPSLLIISTHLLPTKQSPEKLQQTSWCSWTGSRPVPTTGTVSTASMEGSYCYMKTLNKNLNLFDNRRSLRPCKTNTYVFVALGRLLKRTLGCRNRSTTSILT